MNLSYEQQLAAIGQRLKYYRQNARLTTVAAAQLAGVSFATLCNAENGKLNLRLINFLKMSDSLQIPPQLFFRPMSPSLSYQRDVLETKIIDTLSGLSDRNLEMLGDMIEILRRGDYNFSATPTPAANTR